MGVSCPLKRSRNIVSKGVHVSLRDELATQTDRAQLELIKVRRQRDSLQGEVLQLVEKVADLERTLGFVDQVQDSLLEPPSWLAPRTVGKKKHATLTLLLSDTHFDEVVLPEEVGDLNKYDRRIAEIRLKLWADNSMKMARQYLSGVTYDGVVVMLGGDIFSGDIHEELAQTNEDTMLGSLLHWSEQICAALLMFADEFGKVHVPCVVGNHGRMSRKPRMKLRARTNFDWLLGKMIERHLAHDKRFTFQISENADTMVNIYQYGHLLTHGDQVSGGGGIGGIWPPIMRMRARKAQRAMDTGQPFSTLWMGHWHQYISTPYMIVNGSTKGVDEYAWLNNFGVEPPQQALAIVTPEHNITIQAPIFCSDRTKEKW
jgi:hypothetical protein